MKFRNLFIAILAFILVGCDSRDEEKSTEIVSPPQEATISENINAPFSIKMLDGEVFSMLKKESGFDMGDGTHATLFTYFATWCPPCIIEIEPLNNLAKNFGKNLKIIGILVKDDISDDELKAFIKKHEISYQISRDSEILTKAMGDLKGIPYMVLYDSKGAYDRHYYGIISEEMLQKDIEKLVGDIEIKESVDDNSSESDKGDE